MSVVGRKVATTVLVLASVLAAAGGGASGATNEALPPSSRKELVKLFRARLEPFGLRITRAALVDATNHRSAQGTHLALYVEPTRKYSDDDYLDGVSTVSRLFLPSVFREWPGLRSFDICQEPTPAEDNRAEPPPETQVFVLKQGLDRVNWRSADLADLLTASAHARLDRGRARTELSVFVALHLRNRARYQDALEQSQSDSQDAPASSDTYR